MASLQFSGLFPHGLLRAAEAPGSMSVFKEARKEERVAGRGEEKEKQMTSTFMRIYKCLPKAFPRVSLARIFLTFTHNLGSQID